MSRNIKKTASLLVVLLILSISLLQVMVPCIVATEESWTTKASMQQARGRLGVAVVNGKIYAIGGVLLPPVDALIGGIAPSAVNEQHTPVGYVPEFPSWLVLPLFVMVTLVAIVSKTR